MIHKGGDWMLFRSRFALKPEDEIDFHFGARELGSDFFSNMVEVERMVEKALRDAQKRGRPYVLFRHGWSTSRRGRASARSVVRQFMRSKLATPLIERRECIVHFSVFLAKVRLPGPTSLNEVGLTASLID